MRIALIADTYPPLRSSGAIQLRDLAEQFARQGHEVTVLVASPGMAKPWHLEDSNSLRLLRLRTLKTKDVGYLRRSIAEILMPFFMLRNYRKSPIAAEQWDGVVWYSPSIFLGPIVKALKRSSSCPGYLIIRDIFPEWALDMGLMGRGLPYHFFKAVANYQYKLADVIGIQADGNAAYFADWLKKPGRRLEVLQNWIADTSAVPCSIDIQNTILSGKQIFVYAGNMGIAQGMDILIDLAGFLKEEKEIGFLFVGRGTDSARLKEKAELLQLENILFFDEIEPEEIPGLYAQCHIGLVALDSKHKTHNIPGKFLTYMKSGLPVLAIINPGNDLIKLIDEERVGRVCAGSDIETIGLQALQLLEELKPVTDIEIRCKALAANVFSPEIAVHQIVEALQEAKN